MTLQHRTKPTAGSSPLIFCYVGSVCVLVYVWSSRSEDWGPTGYAWQSGKLNWKVILGTTRIYTPENGCEICLWSAEEGNLIFSYSYPRCPRLRYWSHDTNSAVPYSVSFFIFHTQAKYGAPFLPLLATLTKKCVPIYRQPQSGRSRVYEVITQLCTDGVCLPPRFCRHKASSPQGMYVYIDYVCMYGHHI